MANTDPGTPSADQGPTIGSQEAQTRDEGRVVLEKVFTKPDLLLSTQHSLCPGCGEPVALRTVLELIEELELRERTICVCGIG